MIPVIIKVAQNFSDLDLNFTFHPIKKDVNKLVGDMAVISSLKNLILTNFNERLFQPNIGSNVRRLLFEPLDDITAAVLENEIKQTIINFEPRVSIDSISVYTNIEQNAYNVTIQFSILNKTEPITIKFMLERIR